MLDGKYVLSRAHQSRVGGSRHQTSVQASYLHVKRLGVSEGLVSMTLLVLVYTHFHLHVTLNVHNLCLCEHILASDVVLVGTPGLRDCIQFMKALGCPRDFVMAGCVDGLTVHSQNALFSDILSVLLWTLSLACVCGHTTL